MSRSTSASTMMMRQRCQRRPVSIVPPHSSIRSLTLSRSLLSSPSQVSSPLSASMSSLCLLLHRSSTSIHSHSHRQRDESTISQTQMRVRQIETKTTKLASSLTLSGLLCAPHRRSKSSAPAACSSVAAACDRVEPQTSRRANTQQGSVGSAHSQHNAFEYCAVAQCENETNNNNNV